MRVLLIYPLSVPSVSGEPPWMPLGLSYIAAVLQKRGHVVSIFDRMACCATRGRDRVNDAMVEHIRDFAPGLIGFNTVSPLIYDTVECVGTIRKFYKGLVIAGGHHATAMPELTLRKIPGLDGVIEGEGEYALADLADGKNPDSIPGVWWRKGDALIHTPPVQIEDIDSLPHPAFDLLDMGFYLRKGTETIRGYYLSTVSMLTSRGCTQRCDFCTESLTYGRGVRFHSPEYVLEQIKMLITDYKMEGIYFHDNDFLIDEARAVRICEGIIKSGLNSKIKWAIQTRVDRVNEGILKLLKQAGCIKIELGVEAASQEQLDSMHKGTTVNESERAIAMCHGAGIHVHAYMMTGFEGETVCDLENMLKWVKKVKADTFQWGFLKIHPGTALYRRKGDSFFEENPWTRENITSFYRKDVLSAVSMDERMEWMKLWYNPCLKKNRRLNIIRVNPVSRTAVLAAAKVKRSIKRVFSRA